MMTPSQLSTKALTRDGWLVDTVERAYARRKFDLFGMFDLLAIRGTTTLAVQVTTASNVSSRVRKVLTSPHLAAVRKAGWGIEVHGWRKSGECRVVDLSQPDAVIINSNGLQPA